MIGKETNLCNLLVIARWAETECELLEERVNRILREMVSREKCFLETEKAIAGFKDSRHTSFTTLEAPTYRKQGDDSVGRVLTTQSTRPQVWIPKPVQRVSTDL